MAVGDGDVADVAGGEVEGARVVGPCKDGGARRAGDEEGPLVRVEMPVDLAHRTRLDREEAHAEVGGDVEGRRVDDLHGAAGDGEGDLLREVIGVGLRLGQVSRGTGHVLRGDVGRGGRAVEDVELLGRDVGEVGDVGLEVLGQHFLGVVREDLADQVGVVVGEVALVEDEDELGALVERLDAVRHAGGEEPEVASLQVVDEIFAVLVHRCDAYAAVEDVGPFVG